MANPLFHLIFPEFQPSSILELLPPSLGLEIPIKLTVPMTYSAVNKEVTMTYEDLVNKRQKEPEDGKFEETTKEILEAVSGDSDSDDDEKMEPVPAIPAHLAYKIS